MPARRRCGCMRNLAGTVLGLAALSMLLGPASCAPTASVDALAQTRRCRTGRRATRKIRRLPRMPRRSPATRAWIRSSTRAGTPPSTQTARACRLKTAPSLTNCTSRRISRRFAMNSGNGAGRGGMQQQTKRPCRRSTRSRSRQGGILAQAGRLRQPGRRQRRGEANRPRPLRGSLQRRKELPSGQLTRPREHNDSKPQAQEGQRQQARTKDPQRSPRRARPPGRRSGCRQRKRGPPMPIEGAKRMPK